MKRFVIIVAVFFVAIFSLQIASASQNAWYVAKTGNDVIGNGSIEAPFLSIQHAIKAASDGDTVIVMEGRYTGPGNTNLNFLGKAITVRSCEPEDDACMHATIIDAEGQGVIVRFVNDEGPESIFAGFSLGEGDTSAAVRGLHGFFEFSDKARPTTRRLRIEKNTSNLSLARTDLVFKTGPPFGGRAWEGNNPFHQPAATTDYYGSGDVNGDGELTLADILLAQEMADGLRPPSHRADVDGNGEVNSIDILHIDSALVGGVLPGWWNSLTEREDRESWVTKFMAIDQTDEHSYVPGWFMCMQFATQTYINGAFYRGDLYHEEYNGGPTVFNLPLYYVSVSCSSFGHGINAILVGDDPLNFYDWFFLEPQTDQEVHPGMWDMPYGTDVTISSIYSIGYGMRRVNKVCFSINVTGWTIEEYSPDLILTKPTPIVKIPDNRPDLWNPRIVSGDSGIILYECSRDDMSRTTDIHIADLTFADPPDGKPLVLSLQYSRLLDISRTPDGTIHMLWKGIPEYNPGIFHGKLNSDDRILTDVTRISNDSPGTLRGRIIITPSGGLHIFWLEDNINTKYPKGLYWTQWTGSGWQPKKNLSPDINYPTASLDWDNRDFRRYLFDVTVLRNNNIILVWTEKILENTVLRQLRYDGEWGIPITIDTINDGLKAGVSLLADSTDTLHLVYWLGQFVGRNRGNLVYRTYDGISWSSPDVFDDSGNACCPQMIEGDDGIVYLVWERKIEGQVVPVWSKYTNGVWDKGQLLSIPHETDAWYPTPGLLPDGNLVVAWSSHSFDRVAIETATAIYELPPHSYGCPNYDYFIHKLKTSYNTHSASFNAGECRVYRFALTADTPYTFTTCEGGGNYSNDTMLELYDTSCNQVAANNDYSYLGSHIDYTPNASGYFYLKIENYGNDDPESYTLAYRENPHTIVTLSPDTIDFCDVIIGQTTSRSLIITNNGNDDIIIDEIFYQNNGFTLSIPEVIIGGERSEQFPVNFTANTEGQVEESLIITGSGTRVSLSLIGNGTSDSNILTIGSATKHLALNSDSFKVTVPIILNLDTDLSEIFFTILYDTNIFDTDFNKIKIENTRITTPPTSEDIVINDNDGRIEVGLINFRGGTSVTRGQGLIFNIGFVATNPQIGSFPLSLEQGISAQSTTGNMVNIAGQCGEISIIDQCIGDVDGDCIFNVKDIILIYRSMFYSIIAPTSWREQNPDYPTDSVISESILENWDCFDVDNNDEVTVNDLVYMYRSLFFSRVVPLSHREFNPEILPDKMIRDIVEELTPQECNQLRERLSMMRAKDGDNSVSVDAVTIDNGENDISVDTVNGVAGTRVSVPVEFDIYGTDLSQLFLKISYSSDLIDPNRVEIETSRILIPPGPDDIIIENGTIEIGFFNCGGGTAVTIGEGKILDIFFDIKPDVTTKFIPISVQFVTAMRVGGQDITDIVKEHGGINISICPEAQFSTDVTSICPGGIVEFSDQSSNDPVNWEWDFGDEGSSKEQNPSHIYTNSGIFTVSLTVGNFCGSDTETKVEYIKVWEIGTSCSIGIGECERTGIFICNVEGTGIECSAIAGDPNEETCDGLDNDCDGSVDEEDTKDCIIYYKDNDQDGYGVGEDSRCLCNPDDPNKYTALEDREMDDDNPLIGGYIDIVLNMPAGWSMISLPVIPYNAELSELFPEATVAYCYENGIGYVQVTKEEELEVEKGYWILLDQNQNYTFSGASFKSYTLPVYEDGWYMIGGCSYHAQALSDSCSISVIYGYVQGTGYQRILKTGAIDPGKAYWILLNNVMDQAELTVETTGQEKY